METLSGASKLRNKKQPKDKAISLLRNTTYRCGKLEKSIIQHLMKNREKHLGSSNTVSVNDIVSAFSKNKSETHDAIRRLQKRKIIELRPQLISR